MKCSSYGFRGSAKLVCTSELLLKKNLVTEINFALITPFLTKVFSVAFLVQGLNRLQVTSLFVGICRDLSGFVGKSLQRVVRFGLP